MKTVFVTLLRGSTIRNLLHTGVVGRLLRSGVRVVLLTPNFADKELFEEFRHPNLILEPLHMSRKRCYKILEELMRGAAFNRTVHFLYRYTLAGQNPPRSLYYLPRMLFMAPLRFIPGFKRFIRWVDYKINPEREHDYLFEKYKPDLVFNSASRGDEGVLKSALRFGVPTIDMPKTWDNLSKVLFNVKADTLVVWSPFMKEQAVRFQGYAPDEIEVVGIPQFDFYARKDGLMSRGDFCKEVGADPQKKLILFSSTGGDMCDEAYFVEMIRAFMDAGEIPDANIIVRPHIGYRKDIERFSRLSALRGVIIDAHDRQQSDKFKDNWDTRIEHVHHLVNSLYHADVVINLASTMTLDATACGTPVINPAFNPPGAPRHHSATRLYGTDYVRAVRETGIAWVPESMEEYKNALHEILIGGGKRPHEMQKVIHYFMFKNDGRSAERLADAVLSKLNGE